MHQCLKGFVFTFVLLGLAAALPASADDATTKLGNKVIAALTKVANGSCPSDLMSPLLLDQCEQGLGRMQEALSKLGEIKEANYRGIEQLPNGVDAKAFKVIFAKGSMMWFANESPNGKLNVLWSPG